MDSLQSFVTIPAAELTPLCEQGLKFIEEARERQREAALAEAMAPRYRSFSDWLFRRPKATRTREEALQHLRVSNKWGKFDELYWRQEIACQRLLLLAKLSYTVHVTLDDLIHIPTKPLDTGVRT